MQVLRPHSADTVIIVEPEPLEEDAHYNLMEIDDILLKEVVSINKKLDGWIPPDSMLVEVLPMIPQDSEAIESADITAMLTNIQNQFIIGEFLSPFIERLDSLKEDVFALSAEDRIKHYFQTHMLTIQINTYTSIATQILIANAYLYRRRLQNQENEQEPPAKETITESEPLTWGIQTGEA